MSIHRVHVSIFSFDRRLDYQNGYVSFDLSYKPEMSLLDFFDTVPGGSFGGGTFSFDRSFISCRINGVAVFCNPSVGELVDRFGLSWVVDPLSSRYASKDLTIDYRPVLDRYGDFFSSASFLSPRDEAELYNYIHLNFVSGIDLREYVGDGFLVYISRLLSLYPGRYDFFVEYITGDNGIMCHTPVASLMYPESNYVDVCIEGLQRLLVTKPHFADKGLLRLYKKVLNSVNATYRDTFSIKSYLNLLSPVSHPLIRGYHGN